ncbi:MAG: ComEA family DNA-binding protein [bacterium]
MTIFTPQERRVVLLLLATLLAGSAVRVYRTRHGESLTHPASGVPFVSRPDTESPDASVLDTLIRRVERRLEGESEPDLTRDRIDINSASERELCLLPGIGPKLAGRIAAYRESHGEFEDIRDLVNVPGIGEKKLSQIRDMVKVGGLSDEGGSPQPEVKQE